MDESTSNLYKDVLFILLLAFLVIIMMIIPFINDPGKKAEDLAKPPGKIMVEFFWDDKAQVDIDGWVKGPKDLRPVGYTNKDDIQFELLRDDRGTVDDVSGRNFENFYARGIYAGEYLVNVHWYGGRAPTRDPMEVTVVVTVYDKEHSTSRQILVRKIKMRLYDDVNVFIFKLDSEGVLVKDSVYTDPRINLKLGYGISDNVPPQYLGDQE